MREGIKMEFLRNLFVIDYWQQYDIISALFGVILCFVLKKKQAYDICSAVIICAVNAYWLGAIFLFRFFYSARSFFYGGIIGVFLVLLFYILFRSKIIYLAGVFICGRIICLLCNLLVENDSGRTEEIIVFCSYFFAIIVVFAIMGYLLVKEKMKFEDFMPGILFPLYGSFLITRCWFDLFNEIEYKMGDYLVEESEYINFYKYITKIDWKGEVTIFFVVMFLFIALVGCVMQRQKTKKSG